MSALRRRRPPHVTPPVVTDWWDTTYEQRLRISATNTSGADLHDALVTYTPAVAFDTPSLRVVETTALGGVERAFDWRYGPLASNDVNHLPVLPVSVAGGVVTCKSLGRWAAGETRYFTLYWSALNGQSALSYGHLDCVAYPWTVAFTAGATGDTYAVVVHGTTYTYVQIGGDTATTIAVAFKALINAGSVATATNSAGTLSIFSATPRDAAYTVAGWVATTGSTTPGNLVVTASAMFGIGRVGPDLFTFAAPSASNSTLFGLGTGVSSASSAGGYLGHGRPGANGLIRMLRYAANGDGTGYFTTGAVISTVVIDGPTVTVTGTMSTTPTGSNPNRWTAAWTATYRHKVVAGKKSDNTNANNVPKYVDLVRFGITWTCGQTYAPQDVATGNTSSNHVILALADVANVFTSNVTEDAGNKIPNYYQLASGGGIVGIASSADIHTVPIVGTVMGSSGNTHALGVVVHSIALSGFGAAAAQWFANSTPVCQVQLNGLSHLTTIPAGASITVDCTIAEGYTSNPTTTGDNLLPSELVALLQSVHAAATGTPSLSTALVATETYNGAVLARSQAKVSTALVAGIQWKQTNAATLFSGKDNNYAFAYNPHTGAALIVDDLDGNLGEAFALAGLCLRYLRTGDASLLPLIERQVRFHIDLERDAMVWYGSWFSGSAPYFWLPVVTSALVQEGGFQQPNSAAQVDPNAGTYGASLTPPQNLSVGLSGGANRGTYVGGTSYANKDWVKFTDVGGTYVGVSFYAQWTGSTSSSTPFPTDGSGNLQGSWATKSPLQYTMNYAVNQPRASTSNDQLHAVCLGLYHYLYLLRADATLTAVTPPTWRVGDIVRGATNDVYVLTVGASTVTYTQVGGDTDAYLLAGHLAAAINADAGMIALGVVATVAPSTATAPGLAALYLTGCTGLTVTNAGTTHTANMPVATLRDAAIALLGRMADFQSAALAGNTASQPKNLYAQCAVPGFYNLVTGTTAYATSQNGIATHLGTLYSNYAALSALTVNAYSGGSQYGANTFGTWELLQTSGGTLTSDSNGAIAQVFQTIVAAASPDGQLSDQAAVIAYLQGRASDCLALDMGRHAWHFGSSVTVYGQTALATYPPGWNLRSAATGNAGLTQAAAPVTTSGPYGSSGVNDAHYLDINSAGVRDNLNGRAYERMVMLCLLALFNPNAMVLVEMDATASPNAHVVRQVGITDLIDDLARTLGLYLIDPTTSCVRFGAAGPLGAATGVFNPVYAHMNFTGYAQMAVELWFLVQQRLAGVNRLPTYYKFAGV